jgi:N-acetylneuraminic acid mutarotase/glucose/arabinose dehydrogenase
VNDSSLRPGRARTLALALLLSIPLASTAAAYELRVSSAPDRSGAVLLQGAQVSGLMYVFVLPETGISRVRFFVNNPTMTGTPVKTEGVAPYDLAGTAANGTALPYDTAALPAGSNTVTAAVDRSAGGTEVVTATFTVAAAPPALAFGSDTASLSAAPGATATAQITLQSSDGGAAAFSTAEDAPWLTVTPATGSTPATLTLTADATGLAAGTYTTTVVASASGYTSDSLGVTFTVGSSGTYALVVSGTPDRAGPAALDGSTQSGDIYVFVSPATGITRVRFYLDNPSGSGTPFQTENSGPWDLAGTASTGGANPFHTATLSNASHSVTAAIDRSTGGTVLAQATFTVDNASQALLLSPAAVSLSASAGGSASTQLNLNTSAGTASFTVSDTAPWLTVEPSSGTTPAALAVTADATGLADGTYTATVTAAAAGYLSDSTSVSFTVSGGGGPAQCSPVPCEEILVSLPYQLTFDADHGKIQDGGGVGTGFTFVSQPSNGTGYVPALLHVDTAGGTLQVTTTAGLAYESSNSLDNALGVGIDAPSQITRITTTLVNPPAGTGNYEQAGLWFGNDEDNHVKLSVLSTSSGAKIEYLMEVGGVAQQKKQTSALSLSGTIALSLRADPNNRSIAAIYQIGAGPEQTLATFTAPPEFFSFDAAGIDPRIGTRSFGGIFASHRNGPAPLVYPFGSFSVVEDTSAPPPPGGGGGGTPSGGFSFDRSSFTVQNPTAMVWGPDDRLYVTEMMGKIHALTLDANKQVVADQQVTTLGSRLTLGIAVDPFSTPTNVVLWVAHSSPSLNSGVANSSTVSRLSGPGFATRQDVITGLPRAIANHAINSLHFGPDGRLYIAQAGNTGAGAPNTANTEFFTRPEQPLSAALLVADVHATGFQGTCASAVDDSTGTAAKIVPASCHVAVYASGLRNIYDFVHHSNGHIYAPENGLGVKGTFPATPTPDCQGIVTYSTQFDPGEQPDTLLLLQAGRYYGHPNPARDECVFGNGSRQGVSPLPTWTPALAILGNNRSADGMIEYTGAAFCGDLRGDLLIANYSVGDNITRVRLAADGLSVTGMESLVGGFTNPLPLAMDPDGTIYVGEHGGNKVTVLRPREGGCWTTKQPLPQAVLDAGGTALNGKLYLVAGKTSAGPQSTMYVYDPAADAWTTGPSLPGVAVENPAVVALNGKLYAFGGSTAPFSGSVTNAAVFDPVTNAWTSLAAMPVPRGGATAKAIGSVIYVVGGMNGGASLETVSIYNPGTNTWTAGPSMGTRRDNPGSAVLNGKLYVFGGRTRNADGTTVNGTLNTVEMFDPSTGTWTARAPMPTGRRTMVVGTLNGRAQVMGGEAAPNGSAFGQNEEYDPVADAWTALRSMPTPRHGAVAGTINDVVYVVAGGPTAGTAFTSVNEAFSFQAP